MIDLDWLRTRRWFGGKGAAIADVRVLNEARVSAALACVTIEVTYAGGRAPERYLLPVRPGGPPGRIEETLDEDALLDVLGLIRGGRTVRTDASTIHGERFSPALLDALPARPSVRHLSAEQSNTSVVFGEQIIVKLIRKLEHGRNPELEIGALLSRADFRATPELAGALSVSGAVEATLAVAHRFVPVEADGWSYVLASLKSRAPTLLAEALALGTRVGELHLALASDKKDPAFAPEPITRADHARWTGDLLRELDATVKLASAAVPGLAARAPLLRRRIERLRTLKPSGVKIRQHGDLHLGQVLRSEGQWLIFDFEGEPARTLGERRAKHCPWKDAAGMLRSFAYAGGAAQDDSMIPDCRRAFLRGYRAAAAALLPDDERVLLESLELEKLLYELRYEVGHRPDWVRIPARDLLSMEAHS